MSDRSSTLSVRGIERNYQTGDQVLHVLKGADIDIAAGEIVGLVGPSGCGKSSLLHAIGLLERPNAGSVWIKGEDALALSDRQRTRLRRDSVGFVYQFHHLLPEFSALDNVAIPQMITGKGRRAAREEAEALLVELGLGERLTHQPAQLSGGERQRVAIARALVNDPDILLADEPTGNLDPETSDGVFTALTRLARERNLAALIATHNHDLAAATDRVLTLEHGLIEPSR
ncbi:ABC transporter ATP-binding protein [Euryhalocaulis caribicus]|uniref:ABC transporter ATP-binding protein n=1 Tax=Euryhalocaulis caribicus TaxID=1161401 RepID=UPI0003A01AEA|nr:ABC transporter ATP-binding protein [Euryhalocaulis caribicus]